MDKVADMKVDKVADMEVHMVANMEVDKVQNQEYKAWNVLKQTVLGRSCLMRSVPELRVF